MSSPPVPLSLLHIGGVFSIDGEALTGFLSEKIGMEDRFRGGAAQSGRESARWFGLVWFCWRNA